MAISDDEWVARLPAAITVCAERWGLTVSEPLSGGLVSHVLACKTGDGKDVVLKLTPPSADDFAGTPEQEAAALGAWDGRGAVRLLGFAPDLRALLTSRARPGTPLPPGDERQTRRTLAGVLAQLFEAKIPNVSFRALTDVVDQHLVRKLAGAGRAAEPLAQQIAKARASAERLAATAPRRVLLHGDTMDKNILRDDTRFVAIDPMPCIGDPHSDIGFWSAMRSPPQELETRAAEVARLLDHDPDRAVRWAAVYAAGSACETWRDDTRQLRAWVQGAHAAELLSP